MSLDTALLFSLCFMTFAFIVSFLMSLKYRKDYDLERKTDKISTDLFMKLFEQYKVKIVAQEFLIQKLNDTIAGLKVTKKDNVEDSI